MKTKRQTLGRASKRKANRRLAEARCSPAPDWELAKLHVELATITLVEHGESDLVKTVAIGHLNGALKALGPVQENAELSEPPPKT